MREFKALKLAEQGWFVKRFMVVTAVIGAIFIAILFLPWQQTVYGVGTLNAFEPTQRAYDIKAPVAGVIERYLVEENQAVKKGDLLFLMRDLDAEYQKRLGAMIAQNRQQLQNQKRKIANLQKSIAYQRRLLEEWMEIYEKKRLQIEKELAALEILKRRQQNSVDIERKNFQRKSKLHEEGIVSTRDRDLAYNRYLQALAQLKKVESRIANLKIEESIVQTERKQFE